MTNPAIVQRFCFFLLAVVLLVEVGCVSRHAYEKARAEADELTRTLDIARTDVTEMDRRIAELQAANRQAGAVTAELRAAIQREQDQLSVRRQHADAQLASLQAQVAHLVNQSRVLTRQIADAKQEGTALHAMAEQYKQELEESRKPTPVASGTSEPVQRAPAPSSSVVSGSPANPADTPQQVAQANPVPQPRPITPSPPAKVEPIPVDDSWTGMIMSWLAGLWSLIFG